MNIIKNSLAVILTASFAASAFAGATIPPRPETITYPPLTFTPPKASEYRTTLSDGTTVGDISFMERITSNLANQLAQVSKR